MAGALGAPSKLAEAPRNYRLKRAAQAIYHHFQGAQAGRPFSFALQRTSYLCVANQDRLRPGELRVLDGKALAPTSFGELGGLASPRRTALGNGLGSQGVKRLKPVAILGRYPSTSQAPMTYTHQEPSTSDCLEQLELLTESGSEEDTLILLHGLHYWLLIAIEEQVFRGQIDRGYGAISAAQVGSLRTCADFGNSLFSHAACHSPAAAVSGLRKAVVASDSGTRDATSERAIRYALRCTTDALAAQRAMKSAGRGKAPESTDALRKKVALIQTLMVRIHRELCRLASLGANARQGMGMDEVATVLAVTDATVGILCVIRDASFDDDLADESLQQELEAYLRSDRMEAGGAKAACIMERAFGAVLEAWAAAAMAA